MNTIQINTIQINSVTLKRINDILNITSSDATRWTLNHAQISLVEIPSENKKAWRIIATDGHAMTSLTVEYDQIISSVNVFYVGNYNEKHLKLLLRNHKNYESMIVFEGNDTSFKHGDVLLETNVHGFPSEQAFEIISGIKENFSVSFDLDILNDLVSALGSKNKRITLSFDKSDTSNPLRVKSWDAERCNQSLVICPLKVDKKPNLKTA